MAQLEGEGLIPMFLGPEAYTQLVRNDTERWTTLIRSLNLKGQGPAIVFLHGAGSNGATWWQQLPAFTPHYSCVLMDIRCFGRSGAPVSEFSLPYFVNDLIAVLDQEKIERAALIGQSLGGMVSLRAALEHSQRVSAFVSCDSSMAIDHP
eukprot:gene40910-64885_t